MVTLSYDKRWLGPMWDFEDSDYRESFFHGVTNIYTNKVIQLENKEIKYKNCLYFYELYMMVKNQNQFGFVNTKMGIKY